MNPHIQEKNIQNIAHLETTPSLLFPIETLSDAKSGGLFQNEFREFLKMSFRKSFDFKSS